MEATCPHTKDHYDIYKEEDSKLSNIKSLGGYCAYENWWHAQFKLTFVYGYMHLKTEMGYSTDDTFNGHYSSANLFLVNG